MTEKLRTILIFLGFAIFIPLLQAEKWEMEVVERDSIFLTQSPLEIETTAEVAIPDTINSKPGYLADRDWLYLLKHRLLKPNSPNVHWPKFLGFCMKVYNWADTTFNGYNPEYVRGTGKKWKVRLISDNWVDMYYFHPWGEPAMRLSGNINPSLGAYVNYMAVSLGYSMDMRTLFAGESARHKKFDFQFSCARLVFEAHYWENDGSVFIRGMDDYKNGKWIREQFEGLDFKSIHASLLYVFNHKKFSYGAAYNLANYQIKSAGSFFAGVMGTFYNATFDFTQLPPDIAATAPFDMTDYKMHYNSVLAIGGYSYNWVLNRHWLFNASFFPAVGITWTYRDASDGKNVQLAMSGKLQNSITYVNRQFFMTLNSVLTSNLYFSSRVGFFSAIENFQFATGVRF